MQGLRDRRSAPAWPRQTVVTALALLALVFLLPLFFLEEEPSLRQHEPEPTATLPLAVVPTPALQPVEGWDAGYTLRFLKSDGTVETMTMEDYLWGVVAAEMPASFRSEALKAQAVCARTYSVYQKLGGAEKHPQADVCGDYTCCQAYLTREQAAESWGEDAARYADKVAQAVADTDGLLCLYEGEPIDAVFFSSTEGRTADAAEVWGATVPYLVPVDSPEGEEVPGWRTVCTYPADEVRERISKAWPQADLSGALETWFSSPVLDGSGNVARMTVGGVSATGAQVRAAFGLRSARFTVEPGEGSVTFRVTGYGHGVGMSQYGANALAGEGKDFQAILEWYYTGVTVSGWKG